MRQRLRVRDIVHGDTVNFGVSQSSAQDIPSNASKTIDSHLYWHLQTLTFPCRRVLEFSPLYPDLQEASGLTALGRFICTASKLTARVRIGCDPAHTAM